MGGAAAGRCAEGCGGCGGGVGWGGEGGEGLGGRVGEGLGGERRRATRGRGAQPGMSRRWGPPHGAVVEEGLR